MIFKYNIIGALPITGVIYGPVDRVPIAYASPNCSGNETSLLDCTSNGGKLGQTGFYQDQNNGLENAVAVRCEGEEGIATCNCKGCMGGWSIKVQCCNKRV